jgi:hypothetical protein
VRQHAVKRALALGGTQPDKLALWEKRVAFQEDAMSDDMDQANQNMQGQQNNADNRERMSQAHSLAGQQSVQQANSQDYRGIGETGSTDLGNAGGVAGGTGNNADTSGSAAGATGEQMDETGRKLFSDSEDEDNHGDGDGGLSAAGTTI